VGGAEGRCESTAIPGIATQASQLPSAGCDPNERCAPCVNPLDGTDTGSCHLSCDPGPKTPPVLFPSCCNSRGKCIPGSMVPQDQAGHLSGAGCQSGSLCVPK